jgi:hypothetical protein
VSAPDLAPGFTDALWHPTAQPMLELRTSRRIRFAPSVRQPAIRRIVMLLDRLFNTQHDSE